MIKVGLKYRGGLSDTPTLSGYTHCFPFKGYAIQRDPTMLFGVSPHMSMVCKDTDNVTNKNGLSISFLLVSVVGAAAASS